MHEDGTLAPPATPGGMNLGPQTGFDQGPALGAPPLGGGMAGAMGAPLPPPTPGGPGVLAPSLPPSVAPQPLPPNTLPQGVASSGPAATPPGLPPLELTPPPPDLGGVGSALPGTPPVSTGVGPDLGPSKGLGLDRGAASFFGEEDAATAPSLDPFAYVKEQNRVSATPASEAKDPNGYRGPDVTRSDPTKLLPSRRRKPPVAGPQSRLEQRKGITNIRRPMPARRP
jgi:hypothetical protein